MIISCSRRTDIPALYTDWLIERLRQGFVLTPDRFRPGRLYKIDLTRDKLECLILWTKNPIPILKKLDILSQYVQNFYFQYTVTSYETDYEKNLPCLDRRLSAFQDLSRKIGPERLIWRYDPIIIDTIYTLKWHEQKFSYLARELSKFTHKCVISFVDSYRHFKAPTISPDDQMSLALVLALKAKENGLKITACAEPIDFTRAGVHPASCVDRNLIEQLTKKTIPGKKDPGQRRECRCVESRDIGVYNSCIQGCVYCYATTNRARAQANYLSHDPFSPTLIGRPLGSETIIEVLGLSLSKTRP
ncbi:MAG: DUF1848 domain-containing protein [Deltaproteobacteria bacterium]|jgi:hypothetical protein|nr:DUF1848 domain-containing protein [Deltaproteobacteria bacterium]